ncbi:protein irs4 [Aspergillus tanneri]|uniref:Increased rDNA silencing protein n=2 Tax=Aspergillus tanneri TaxID=1220188 RepID=A0A5M9N635_9EURO|nr:Increased rDNA silencing protein [Aspergillus tanneri]KAA8652549.1 Increased rDNA silencing protein [Aspergillus tanneri]
MASSTSVLDPRPTSHLTLINANSLTALQGAVTAFHGIPSRGVSPAATQRTCTAMGAGRGSEPHSEVDSPELGSVKDKIGRFTSQPQLLRLRNTSEKERMDTPTSKQRSMHQIAAQLAAEKSAMSRETTKTYPGFVCSTQDVNKIQIPPVQNSRNQYVDLLTGNDYPVEGPETNNEVPPSTSSDEKRLPARTGSIQWKPLEETSIPPEPEPLIVVKPRPTPPVPRNTRHVTGIPNPTPTSAPLIQSQMSSREPSLSSRSSVRSKTSTAFSDDNPPPLPARPGGPSLRSRNMRDYRQLLNNNESPSRTLSPSIASIYGRSQHNSSPSLIDMDEEALSNAIVASSLASSRSSPTNKIPPPPPPQRRPRSHSILSMHSGQNELSRTSSPSSTLRQTLRTPAKSDEEEDYRSRHRKHLIRKHPHKHHEGDRKRWRSEITEKERKRYEGVWAANKGLLLTPDLLAIEPSSYPTAVSEMVANVVVRDIWSRSRLPASFLEQIWNLVDGHKLGALTKEEFVVGMWLIDQQLKGHKLPVKVPDSVWASVKRVPGITLSEFSLI